MSGFYSASQFDHAFKPTRLGNYQYGTNPWPGKFAICSPTKPKGFKTSFIADDCGHLLPCVPRNPCTSPWGDYALSIWEQTAPCLCISMLRHPERFVPPRQIFITKEVHKPEAFAAQAARELADPNAEEGVVEDMVCGRTADLGSQFPILKPKMCGDPKTINKRLREQRRAQKKALAAGRGYSKGPAPGSEVITIRLNPTCVK